MQRAWLVGSLSELIEGALAGQPTARTRALLALDDSDLAAAVAGRRGEAFVERSTAREGARLRAAVAGAHSWVCCRHEGPYPAALADLPDPPAVLFGRGDPGLLAELTREATPVTIVGARRPSAYGREMAQRLGREIAPARIPVVSGMALGIDSCAHEGALDAGGFTVAVLGSGPDVPSPARMRALYERICDQGLILTELPPGTQARRWTFPARNRIMAAISAMTVVVEARARSGSLITATIAEDRGRSVGAVPGRVGSSVAAGTNDLLRDGAHVIRGGQDVLDLLRGPGTLEAAGAEPSALDPELAPVLEAVEAGAATQDAVSRASELSPDAVATALVRLELLGVIAADSCGRYRRTTVKAKGVA